MDKFHNKSFEILIVDDNPVARNMYTAALSAQGYRNLRSAHNGKEAWNIIQQGKIDLIVSDYYMPEMDGLELLSNVRNQTGIGTSLLSCSLPRPGRAR